MSVTAWPDGGTDLRPAGLLEGERLFPIRSTASDAVIRAVFDGLVANDRVIFDGGALSITLPLTIAVPGVKVDATRATITQLTSGKPVWDVLYGADDCQIHWDSIVGTNDRYAGYEAHTVGGGVLGWNAAGDVQFRGERISNYSAGVYTSAERGDFKGQIDGFYCGALASSWNPGLGAMDPNGTYRGGNRFDIDVNNVDFGLGYMGQQDLYFNIRGSHSCSPGSPHPAHLVYGTTTRNSIGATGDGKSTPLVDGGGSNEWQRLVIANASGGTYTLTRPDAAETTASIQWNDAKAAVQAALEALPSIGAGKVWVYGTPAQFEIVFDKSLVSPSLLTAASSLTGSGPTITPSMVQYGGNGWGFQFKAQTGAAMGRLLVNGCTGAVIFVTCTDCHVDTVVSVDDLLTTTGSICVDTDCTDVTFGTVKIIGSAPAPTRSVVAALLRGTNCGIDSLTVGETLNTADVTQGTVYLTGTNCYVGRLVYRNAGTGGRSIVSLDGTNNRVTIEQAENVFRPVWFQSTSASTGSQVRINPRGVTWTGTGSRYVQDDRVAVTTTDSWTQTAPFRGAIAGSVIRSNPLVDNWLVTLSAGATTVNNPHAPFGGALLLYELYNPTGGVSGAITWDTQFALLSALATVPATTRRYVQFKWDSTSSVWRELWRA